MIKHSMASLSGKYKSQTQKPFIYALRTFSLCTMCIITNVNNRVNTPSYLLLTMYGLCVTKFLFDQYAKCLDSTG